MYLTGLDLLFWAAGFIENLGLLFALIYRRRTRDFPFFTAMAAASVVKTIVLCFLLRYGTRKSYFTTYWSLAMLDMILELCVVYEIASHVFRPLGAWASDVRGSFVWLVSLSVLVALGLSWLASPTSETWIRGFVIKGNFFDASLMSELFVVMMALSVSAGLPWRTHVARIAQGLGAFSLINMLIGTGHIYFGAGRQVPGSVFLSHIRMAAYLVCISYWTVTLWREEQPVREMTEEMRERLFTLQRQVEYDLNDLRSRKKP